MHKPTNNAPKVEVSVGIKIVTLHHAPYIYCRSFLNVILTLLWLFYRGKLNYSLKWDDFEIILLLKTHCKWTIARFV